MKLLAVYPFFGWVALTCKISRVSLRMCEIENYPANKCAAGEEKK